MKSIAEFLHNTKTQAYLAFTILIGGGLIIVFGKVSETVDNRLFDLMFLIGTFYFGSSKSSTAKDDAIATMANNASQPSVVQTGSSPVVNNVLPDVDVKG